MIYHVVLTNFASEADDAIEQTFRGAIKLREDIPQLAEVRCGLIDPADEPTYDALYEFGFESREDFAAFSAHEAYQQYVAEVLPVFALVVAYNYEGFTAATPRLS